MKGILGKKQLLLAVLVVALGAAVYLNYYFSMQDPLITDTNANAGTGSTTASGQGNLGDSQYVANGTSPSQTTADSGDANDYFSGARKNRTAAREEALDIIKDAIADVKSNEQLQKEALEKTAAIAAAVEQESKIESLIKAKGFADCIAFIEDKKCNIVVKCDGLSPAAALQITDIVTSQSNIVAQNVNIQTVK